MAADQPPQQVIKAIAAYKRGDVEAALRWLEQACREHPQLAPPEIMLANMYFSDEQPAKGRQFLERAEVKHPTDPEPHLIFGDLAWRQQRLSDAQVQYERGRQLLESYTGDDSRMRQLNLRALVGLANVAEARRQYLLAGKLFSEVIAVDPKHGNAHFRLGNVLFLLDRPKEALAEFKAAADLSASAPNATLTLASLYQQTGNAEQAERWLERAISEAPTDAQPRLALAKWQLEVRGHLEAAQRQARAAEQIEPDSLEALLIQGVVAACRGHHDQAEDFFTAVLRKSPGHFLASNQLALALVEQPNEDKRQRAWEIAQMTAQTNPRSAEAAATMGWVNLHFGNLDEAEQQLRLAISSGNVSRDTAYYYSRMLYKRGELAKAKTFLQQALDGNGLFIHRLHALAWQRHLAGNQIGQE